MIIDALTTAIKAILSGIFSILPTFSILSQLPSSVLHFGTNVGDYFFEVDSFLPLHEVLNMLILIVGTALGAIVTYKVANWGWRHIPDIGGFGPGSG